MRMSLYQRLDKRKTKSPPPFPLNKNPPIQKKKKIQLSIIIIILLFGNPCLPKVVVSYFEAHKLVFIYKNAIVQLQFYFITFLDFTSRKRNGYYLTSIAFHIGNIIFSFPFAKLTLLHGLSPSLYYIFSTWRKRSGGGTHFKEDYWLVYFYVGTT